MSGGQVNAGLKSSGRNVLLKVNSLEKLCNLVETFTEEGEDLIVAMAGNWNNTLTSLTDIDEEEAKAIVILHPLPHGNKDCGAFSPTPQPPTLSLSL